MEDASKQALLSAVRSVLIAIGSVVAAKGFLSEEEVTGLVGAVVTILSALWGVWDKYRSEQEAKKREAVAINVGIAVADRTEGATPPVTVANAPAVIEAFAPVVESDAKATGLTVTPDSPIVVPPKKG